MKQRNNNTAKKASIVTVALLSIALAAVAGILITLAALGVFRLEKQTLTIRSYDFETVYTGESITVPEFSYQLVSGKLTQGDVLSVEMTAVAKNVGTYENTFNVKITDKRGNDVTDTYDLHVLYGTLKVTPVSLTLTSPGLEKEYDGTPLRCAPVSLENGNLCRGHVYTVNITGEQTEIGSSPNTFTFKITDKATNEDVTKNYAVTKKEGTLTVTPIYLTVQSESASKVYDGLPLTKKSVNIVSGHLCDGHSLDANVTGSRTAIGQSDNTFTLKIVDEKGKDVSEYYRLNTTFGVLTVVEPSKGNEDDGDGGGGGSGSYFVLSDKSGWLYLREMNFGNEYNYYNFDDPDAWYGKTTSPMVYAGNALKNFGAEVGHCIVFMPKAKANIVYRIMPYYMVDGNEEETSDVLHMVSRDTSYEYEYVPFTYEGVVPGNLTGAMAAEEAEYRNWVYQYYLDVPESTAQVLRQLIAENGLSANSPTVVKDVLHYVSHAAKYNLDYVAEPKNVDRVVYFLTESKEGICQHFAAAATLTFRMLGIPARYVQGFLVEVEAGVKTEVTGDMGHAWCEIYVDGIGWMQVEATPGDGDEPNGPNGPDGGNSGGEKPNQLNALRGMAALTIVTESVSKTYDGQPFEGLTCEFTGELLPGDYVDGYAVDTTMKAGVHPNLTKPIIRDAEGNDVSVFYSNLTWDSGELTILPVSLTIRSGSASKQYDGDPLACTDFTIVAGSLVPGDEIRVASSTVREEKGSENNVQNYVIVRGNVDVTNCYGIQQTYGTLTVTQ